MVEGRLRVGDEGGEVDFDQFDKIAFFKDFTDLPAVVLLDFNEVWFLGFRHLALAGEHGPLGIHDLRGGAEQVEDFVAVLAGQARQQRGNHLHGLACGLLDDGLHAVSAWCGLFYGPQC